MTDDSGKTDMADLGIENTYLELPLSFDPEAFQEALELLQEQSSKRMLFQLLLDALAPYSRKVTTDPYSLQLQEMPDKDKVKDNPYFNMRYTIGGWMPDEIEDNTNIQYRVHNSISLLP